MGLPIARSRAVTFQLRRTAGPPRGRGSCSPSLQAPLLRQRMPPGQRTRVWWLRAWEAEFSVPLLVRTPADLGRQSRCTSGTRGPKAAVGASSQVSSGAPSPRETGDPTVTSPGWLRQPGATVFGLQGLGGSRSTSPSRPRHPSPSTLGHTPAMRCRGQKCTRDTGCSSTRAAASRAPGLLPSPPGGGPRFGAAAPCPHLCSQVTRVTERRGRGARGAAAFTGGAGGPDVTRPCPCPARDQGVTAAPTTDPGVREPFGGRAPVAGLMLASPQSRVSCASPQGPAAHGRGGRGAAAQLSGTEVGGRDQSDGCEDAAHRADRPAGPWPTPPPPAQGCSGGPVPILSLCPSCVTVHVTYSLWTPLCSATKGGDGVRTRCNSARRRRTFPPLGAAQELSHRNA